MRPTHRSRVAVLGLGQMGTEIARVLAEAGHDTTVWNRTSARTEAFKSSASVASSADEACRGADLVLSVLSNYTVTDELLKAPGMDDALSGKTLVQMSTGTPDEARSTASWAVRTGVAYLEAKIVAYPNSIGTDHSSILYSGDPETFGRWQHTLAPLAGVNVLVGKNVTDAATLDLAWLGFWYGASAAFHQSLALCRAEQLPVETLSSQLRWMVDFIELTARDSATRVENDDFSGTDCTLEVHRSALEHVVRASRDAGIDDRVPRSVVELFSRAIALGHGGDELPALDRAVTRTSSR
ncbi:MULTISPECIES: NAD(P)-binding domain-containing protein [unclassified Nocardioides]|uniref:NAD(P)-dependent oxidoreductase n=1 Tax=unclassified Nocardioides TaxID=2615069 RepID=UPI000056F95D|nr:MULTISPECIES: NAD(P)-binding domain-containing protein [unclassified Nocardioides]ABL80116.1 6-phosphogluconate dehydrogenase, NAD-binding protein [Nocardioides sp. JS614]